MDVHVYVHDPEFPGAYQPKSQKVDLICQLPSPQVESLEVDRVVQSGVWRVATCLVLPSHHHTHYSTPPATRSEITTRLYKDPKFSFSVNLNFLDLPKILNTSLVQLSKLFYVGSKYI